MKQIFGGVPHTMQLLKPHSGVRLLILCGLHEKRGDLLIAFVPGHGGEVGVLVPGLGLAGKGGLQILLGLGAGIFAARLSGSLLNQLKRRGGLPADGAGFRGAVAFMNISANFTFPFFHNSRFSFRHRFIAGNALQQCFCRLNREITGRRRVRKVLQQPVGVGALRKHIPSFPQQILIDQANGFLHGRHQATEPVLICRCRQLPCNVLLVRLLSGHSIGTGHHRILLRLLRRVLRRYHGDGAAGAGVGTQAAAQAFLYVNDAVLRVRGPGRTDIQAETILGA